jgi:hypothetical protein
MWGTRRCYIRHREARPGSRGEERGHTSTLVKFSGEVRDNVTLAIDEAAKQAKINTALAAWKQRHRCKHRIQMHSLVRQRDVYQSHRPVSRSHRFLYPPRFRCACPHVLQRLDVARASLHQQVVQGTAVLHRALHLRGEVLGNVDRKPLSLVPYAARRTNRPSQQSFQ